MDTSKIPVTERALTQRINRVLAKEGQQLTKNRSERWKSDLGDWYVIDTNANVVTRQHCNVEELGKETGALKPHEYLCAE